MSEEWSVQPSVRSHEPPSNGGYPESPSRLAECAICPMPSDSLSAATTTSDVAAMAIASIKDNVNLRNRVISGEPTTPSWTGTSQLLSACALWRN